jgi:hypothetical protein
LLARSASAAPTPTADYVFNGNLNSAVAGAPALTVVGGGITAFASESVLGSTQTVLTFPVGTGLALVPTTSVLSDSGVYTVIALVRLSGASCPCKYLDLDNRASDEGLYDIGSSLAFPGYPFLHDPVIGTDYVEIALTRAANGDQAGYVFANQKISFNDSLNSYGVVGAANTLNFFIDDVIAGGLEDSAGAVARIRIWNSALSPDEITAVSIQTVFRDGFE